MEPQQNQLSAADSLEIITGMIREAQGNIRRNSFYYLLWGWVVVTANLGVYSLIQLGVANPFWMWVIVIPAWLLSMFRGFRDGRQAASRTHLDKINGWMWMIFGFTVFAIVLFGYKINWQLNPIILIVSTIPTFVSGIIIRFRPLTMGGISFLLMGVICFLVPRDIQFLVGALAVICGFLIPGYMIKRSANV